MTLEQYSLAKTGLITIMRLPNF